MFPLSLSTLLAWGGVSHSPSSLPGLLVSDLLGSFLFFLTTVVTALLAETSCQPQDSVFLSQIKCLFINQITYVHFRNHLVPTNSKLCLSKWTFLLLSDSSRHPQSALLKALPLGAFCCGRCGMLAGNLCSPRLCFFVLFSTHLTSRMGIFLKIYFPFLFLLDL